MASLRGSRKPGLRRATGGQSLLEGTVLFLVAVAALVTFFTIIRAAVSGRIKTGADSFGHGMLHDGN